MLHVTLEQASISSEPGAILSLCQAHVSVLSISAHPYILGAEQQHGRPERADASAAYTTPPTTSAVCRMNQLCMCLQSA